MEPTANPEQIIKYISQPAFLVKDGIVKDANDAASSLHIKIGSVIEELIVVGLNDYQKFSSGKLYLQLKPGWSWVSVCDDYHLFTVDTSYTTPELRAFALAAQHLRDPLSGAVTGMEMLLQNDKVQDEELKKQLGQINHRLYQMIRAVCNMSDVSQLGSINTHPQLQNATSVFNEIFEKADNLIKEAGRTLDYRAPQQAIDCILDTDLLERAILNLISNAIKYSPVDSSIKAALTRKDNRLILTIENNIKDRNSSSISANAFSRFLREPGIESGQYGIGIGMSIISRTVSVHNGTVLLNTNRQKDCVKVMISIPIRTKGEISVKSPLTVLGGYTGGINQYLIELSDVLPDYFYESI